jgi:hypothetical protein
MILANTLKSIKSLDLTFQKGDMSNKYHVVICETHEKLPDNNKIECSLS